MQNILTTDLLRKIGQLLEDNSVAIGHQTISLGASASSLTIPDGAKSALIQIESDNTTAPVMRFWEDGTLPTTTVGMFRLNGDFLEVTTAQNLVNFRAINVTGTTKLQITYYK